MIAKTQGHQRSLIRHLYLAFALRSKIIGRLGSVARVDSPDQCEDSKNE